MTATLPAEIAASLGITEPGEIILEVTEVLPDGSATVSIESEGEDEEEDDEMEEAPGPMPPAVSAMIRNRRGPAAGPMPMMED